jgi:hypothetical protein
MTAARAPKVSKLWKAALCDPRGTLTSEGSLMLADLAKYCGLAAGPTRHDAAGRVDEAATMEAVGMQKLYRRICALVSVDEMRATKLAMMQWPQSDEDEDVS